MSSKAAWILGGVAALYWWIYRGYKALVMRFDGITFGYLDLAANTVTVYLNMVLRNPLLVDLYMEKISGKLYIQDVLVSDMDTPIQMTIGGQKLLKVGIPIKCNISGLSDAIKRNILSGDLRTLTVKFDGVIDMGQKVSVPLPIHIFKDWGDLAV